MTSQTKRKVPIYVGPIVEAPKSATTYEDVIPASISFLNKINRDKADLIKQEYSVTLDGMRNKDRSVTMEGYLFEALMEAINEELGHPYYFGANEKDSRIGIWDIRSPTGR